MDYLASSYSATSNTTPVRNRHMSLLDTSSSPTPTTSLPSPPHSPPPSATRRVVTQSDGTKKTTRRQSSISYVSSRVDVYSRHALSTSTAVTDSSMRTEIGHASGSSFQVGDGPTKTSRSMKRHTMGGLEDLHRSNKVGQARADVCDSKAPLTLADKHADLLHVIAAAESRRLELQGQLATVEGELVELKRKLERIVNREPPHPIVTPYNGHTSVSVVDGLKEGVRLLAAGLSDLSPISAPAPAPAMNMEERAGISRRHSQRQSDSSTSVSTGCGRLSTSSVSSVWDGDTHFDVGGKNTEDGGLCLTGNGQDNEVAWARQTKVFRRRSRDVSHPPPAFTRHATSCTSVDLASTLDIIQGTSNPAMGTPIAVVGISTSEVCARDADGLGSGIASNNALRSKHSSNAALPSPSSMPGAGSFSVVGETWGTVGRKLGSDVFSKSQKRASVILTDVSQSIVSALSPGPVATTPAPMPMSSLRTTSSSTSSLRGPSPSTTSLRTPTSNTNSPLARSKSLRTPTSKILRTRSWLEDDDEEITMHAGSVMMPSVLKSTSTPSPINATTTSSFDDDDWNW